jgi:L-amino acid N-acyltransferase YncA
MTSRTATLEDAAAIARIYNPGIEDRSATFETPPRSAEDIRVWFDAAHPIVVVGEESELVAFAATSSYRPRECYAGIADTSVCVTRAFRRRGAGSFALLALIQAAQQAGSWKLLPRIFPDNVASRGLVRELGFREVVERLLA